jgi:predicted TIM-barrel fold metal-dependent hydrolase
MNLDKLISADDHVQETPDLWEKRLPVHLRDRAPKIVRLDDGAAAWAWGRNPPRPLGRDVWAGREIHSEREIEAVPWEKVHPGTYEPHARLKAMDDDGIYAAVLYPNFARAFIGMWLTDNDPSKVSKLESELAVACIEAYNDFIAEFAATNSKRLIPIGIIPMESVEAAVAEIKRMGKKGIRGGLIPPDPGKGRFWNDPQFEPIWQVMADLGMSVNLHVGALPGIKLHEPGRGQGSAQVMRTLNRLMMALPVSTFLWSGVFDRHPSMNFVAVETDVGWLSYVRHRAEWVFKNGGSRWQLDQSLKNPPGYYFGRNLFATFQEDVAGIESRNLIGIDALCWASDFPHPETTWPHTKETLAEQFKGVPEAELNKLVWENSARLYNITA